jgi:hypothetical protein
MRVPVSGNHQQSAILASSATGQNAPYLLMIGRTVPGMIYHHSGNVEKNQDLLPFLLSSQPSYPETSHAKAWP